jgi:hypothetical protein
LIDTSPDYTRLAQRANAEGIELLSSVFIEKQQIRDSKKEVVANKQARIQPCTDYGRRLESSCERAKQSYESYRVMALDEYLASETITVNEEHAAELSRLKAIWEFLLVAVKRHYNNAMQRVFLEKHEAEVALQEAEVDVLAAAADVLVAKKLVALRALSHEGEIQISGGLTEAAQAETIHARARLATMQATLADAKRLFEQTQSQQ